MVQKIWVLVISGRFVWTTYMVCSLCNSQKMFKKQINYTMVGLLTIIYYIWSQIVNEHNVVVTFWICSHITFTGCVSKQCLFYISKMGTLRLHTLYDAFNYPYSQLMDTPTSKKRTPLIFVITAAIFKLPSNFFWKTRVPIGQYPTIFSNRSLIKSLNLIRGSNLWVQVNDSHLFIYPLTPYFT